MIVRFGLDFNIQLPDLVQNCIGHVSVGPAGMLAILETQLGLTTSQVSTAKRLVQYHACLNRLNTPKRFYHKSFGADALSVTRTLLGWRDQWYESGWTGTFDGKIDSRLKAMAEVEAEAKGVLAPCIGQYFGDAHKYINKKRFSS
jgi:hypothetical protein